MDSLKRQRIESQIRQLIAPYIDSYKGGSQGIQLSDIDTGHTKFNPEFLDHLPAGTKSV